MLLSDKRQQLTVISEMMGVSNYENLTEHFVGGTRFRFSALKANDYVAVIKSCRVPFVGSLGACCFSILNLLI